jgi:hypothetical protein
LGVVGGGHVEHAGLAAVLANLGHQRMEQRRLRDGQQVHAVAQGRTAQ